MMVIVGAALQLRFGQENGKFQSLQNFSDDKNDVKENWSLTKNIDLTLNATALILINKKNIIYKASNCYFAQMFSTLY